MPIAATGNKKGARLKLTPQLRQFILDGVKANMPVSRMADAAGISKRTFYNWRGTGQEVLAAAEALGLENWRDLNDHPQGRKLDATERTCAEFAEELVRVEALGELRLVVQWTKAAEDDWRAAQALLAVRHRERWMEVRGQVLTGDPDAFALSDGEIAKRIQANPEALEKSCRVLELVTREDAAEIEEATLDESLAAVEE